MSSEVLLTTLAHVETDESGHGGAERQLLPLAPLEFDILSRLPEPNDEELDAVLSGEKSHDGGDHTDADTQHRIEHIEPFFRLCAWFGLHAAATAPLKLWQKAHGILILILFGACGIRSARVAGQSQLPISSRAQAFLLVAYFVTSIPAYIFKLRVFWSRSQLHRSFSLLLDPAHDVLMHSARIQFTSRARSISSQKLFCFFLVCLVINGLYLFYTYIANWSILAEFYGSVGSCLAAMIIDSMITPYTALCIICEFSFVEFVCDSHVFAVKRLEALFVSSRLARSLEHDISNIYPAQTLDSAGMLIDSRLYSHKYSSWMCC
jgi:hypothetical protein